jgi:hypothetical protein
LEASFGKRLNDVREFLGCAIAIKDMRPIEELRISGSESRPTASDLNAVEALLEGYSIPSIYKEFIDLANGGHPQLDTFYKNADTFFTINNFFFIGERTSSTDSVAWNYENRWSGIPTWFLPIARDGGDNLFLIELRRKTNSQVWYWRHDIPYSNLIDLAGSFEAFIDGLIECPDYI